MEEIQLLKDLLRYISAARSVLELSSQLLDLSSQQVKKVNLNRKKSFIVFPQ